MSASLNSNRRVAKPTSISRSVKDGNLSLVSIDRQSPCKGAIFILSDHFKKVGHVEAGHDERRRNSDLADVLLDGSLGVKVFDVGQSPLARLSHVNEG